MQKGKWNAITDVPGVKVGHITLHETKRPDGACTGVTAILPHGGNVFENKVPAASFVLNGFGKTVGLVQVEELGVIESPIMLTNTFGVGAVLEGTLRHLFKNNPSIGDTTGTVNVVVGECNDSYLNDIRSLHIEPRHAEEAIERAEIGPVSQGAIGAGKGMICFGHKGGVGSSSRIAEHEQSAYTVGVLALTNFGNAEECRIEEWLARNGLADWSALKESDVVGDSMPEKPDGSIIVVVATDAPMTERQLKRLAKRAAIGLGRTGSTVHHGSGDIIIAFSNGATIPHTTDSTTIERVILLDSTSIMNKLFQAAIEATEEAVFQSMIQAEDTEGRNGRVVKRWPFSSSTPITSH